MDAYYVIDITDNLTDLLNDYNQWAMLKFEFRKRGDEECIRRYGCTNTDLFNKLRSAIIEKDSELPDDTIEEIEIQEEFDPHTKDYPEKVALSKGLVSDCICILIPGTYNTIEELTDDFMKYVNLSDNLKKQSDSYSMSIWGLNVFNMYNTLKAEFKGPKCDIIYNDEMTCINTNTNTDFSSMMRDFVPYFTPDEIIKHKCNLVNNPDLFEEDRYGKVITGLMKDYGASYIDNNPELKSKLQAVIVDLGWNPMVPINAKTIEFAKQRQLEYYNRYIKPQIIDVTHIADNDTVNESSALMRQEYTNAGLYPVYIVLSFNGTIFNNIVKVTQGSRYTHAGLALDSDMKKIYTFTNNKYYQGFGIDTLNMYNETAGDKGLLSVLVLFVNQNTFKIISRTISDFERDQSNTKYNTGNLVNMLFKQSKTDDLTSKELVCSQFVDLVLKIAGIDIPHKANNLVLPEDFRDSTNPKLFKVYEGSTKQYKENKVEKVIKNIFKKFNFKDIQFTND